MNKKTDAAQVKTRWFIDLEWYKQNDRSLSALAEGYLCAKCGKQLSAEGKELSAKDVISTIKDCCANDPAFITGQLPILDSVFRLFLANGNRPLGLAELEKQLSERRGGDIYRASTEILSRLLENERYYGLRPVSS